MHLHRFGSCRGRLDVTRDGVSFVSDEDDDEAFTLKYAEFLHALTDDTLTLRSATRIYRFKVGASGARTRSNFAISLTGSHVHARRSTELLQVRL